MKTIAANQLNRTMRDALDELGRTEEPILIDSPPQKFVVLKEEEYRGWRETAYLLSTPSNAQALQEALEEPLDRCEDLRDVLRELDG